MSNKFETSSEIFPHLWEIPPEIKSITWLNPSEVSNEHLSVLDNHLKWLEKQFPTIASEIKESRNKISKILWLEYNFSWEVMQAANDPDYWKNIKIA